MKTFGTATLVAGFWEIEADPHVIIRLKRIFARSSASTPKKMLLKDTLETCRDLLWATERFPLDVTPRDHLERRAAEHDTRNAEYAKLIGGTLQPRAFELAIPARDYQKVAAEALLRRGSLLLADDMGTGKTISAICALTDPATRPALVVTLTHLPRQWQQQIAKFAPSLRTHILRSMTPYPLTNIPPEKPKRGAKSVDQGTLFSEVPDVIISNYHKLAGWEKQLAGLVRTVIFDEGQELRSGFGNNTPAKYDAAVAIASQANYRCVTSGTPIYNYGGEFYSVLNVIAPDALGSYQEFAREWCTGATDKLSISNPEAFGTWLREQGLMLRRTRADVARELPKCSRFTQEVDANIEDLDKVKTSAVELAKTIVAQGGRGFDKMRAAEELDVMVRRATGIAKAPHVAAFVRMLIDSGEQRVVLFAWHHEFYRIVGELLENVGIAFYTGRESEKQKAEAFEAFRSGKARVLAMSLRAGAGLDGLQDVCRTVVYGELDWSPGVMEQCEARIYRDGQKDPVFVYRLLADVGSDPIMADILGLKRAQLERTINPNAPLGSVQVDPSHIKKLAQAYLEQVGKEAA